jgi:hypothetical protein
MNFIKKVSKKDLAFEYLQILTRTMNLGIRDMLILAIFVDFTLQPDLEAIDPNIDSSENKKKICETLNISQSTVSRVCSNLYKARALQMKDGIVVVNPLLIPIIKNNTTSVTYTFEISNGETNT